MKPNVTATQTRVRQYRRLSALASANGNDEQAEYYEQRADSLTRTLVLLSPVPPKGSSWRPSF